MLPSLIAAGHNKYAMFLPLYLNEMKDLENTCPHIHHQYVQHGSFTVRRRDGSHNGVSPDMLLEQCYSADMKRKHGLTGITMNETAQAKWLYTKRSQPQYQVSSKKWCF